MLEAYLSNLSNGEFAMFVILSASAILLAIGSLIAYVGYVIFKVVRKFVWRKKGVINTQEKHVTWITLK